MNRLGKILFQLTDETANTRQSRVFNAIIIILIIANVVAIVLESFQPLKVTYAEQFQAFETVSVVIFSVEYLLRVVAAVEKYQTAPAHAYRKHIFSLNALIDLVAIVPFYLPLLIPIDMRFIRTLRLLRIARIFKLHRYTRALQIFSTVFARKKEELLVTVLIAGLLLFVSGTIMYFLENAAQPEKFPNIVASLWWAIGTLTTIGYGDVFPTTVLGKIVGGVIAVVGIGLVALPTGILSSGFIEEFSKKKEVIRCPHCGIEINEHQHRT